MKAFPLEIGSFLGVALPNFSAPIVYNFRVFAASPSGSLWKTKFFLDEIAENLVTARTN